MTAKTLTVQTLPISATLSSLTAEMIDGRIVGIATYNNGARFRCCEDMTHFSGTTAGNCAKQTVLAVMDEFIASIKE